MKRLVLVLGFHRSGTSAFAGALERLNTDLGQYEKYANAENPKGFFEHPTPRSVNDQIFTRHASAWWDWRFDPASIEDSNVSLDDLKSIAREFLASELAGEGTFVLKDPRMMCFLPFWQPLFAEQGVKIEALAIVRTPMECVASQLARYESNPQFYHGLQSPLAVLALWCRYHIAMVRGLQTKNISLVSHSELLVEPAKVLKAVNSSLGLAANTADIEASAAFIDPALYRSKVRELSDKVWLDVAEGLHTELLRGPGMVRRISVASLRSAKAFKRAMGQLSLTKALDAPDNGRRIHPRYRDLKYLLRFAQGLPRAPGQASLQQVVSALRYDPMFSLIIGECAEIAAANQQFDLYHELVDQVLEWNPDNAWAVAAKQRQL